MAMRLHVIDENIITLAAISRVSSSEGYALRDQPSDRSRLVPTICLTIFVTNRTDFEGVLLHARQPCGIVQHVLTRPAQKSEPSDSCPFADKPMRIMSAGQSRVSPQRVRLTSTHIFCSACVHGAPDASAGAVVNLAGSI